MSVTREDIERWYSNPAVATVRAPLDPGELDSMEERARYAREVHPTDDDPRKIARFITLLRPFSAVFLQAPYTGMQTQLEPGEYPVASFGANHVVVHSTRGDAALVQAQVQSL